MGISHHDPVGLVVGDQTRAVGVLALNRPSPVVPLHDHVEPGVRAAVPDHVAGIYRIEEDGPNGAVAPGSGVDMTPRWSPWCGDTFAVERIGDGLEPALLRHVHGKDAADGFDTGRFAQDEFGAITLGDAERFPPCQGPHELAALVEHLLGAVGHVPQHEQEVTTIVLIPEVIAVGGVCRPSKRRSQTWKGGHGW
jgi:hypothetical protein